MRVEVSEAVSFAPTLTRQTWAEGSAAMFGGSSGKNVSLSLRGISASPTAFSVRYSTASGAKRAAPTSNGCGNVTCLNGGTCVHGSCFCADGFRGVACALSQCPNECWDRGVCKDDGTCECHAFIDHGTEIPSAKAKAATKAEILKNPAYSYWDDSQACKVERCPLKCSGTHHNCSPIHQ